MFDFVKKIFGTKYDRDVKTYMPLVEKTNEFFQQYKSLSNDELRDKILMVHYLGTIMMTIMCFNF